MAYTVLSPDGITIACDASYRTKADARQALTVWCTRYQRQGYYRDNSWNKIALTDLPGYCEIVRLP